MKSARYPLIFAVVMVALALAASQTLAQQITGELGSPSATTTIRRETAPAA